MHVAESDHLVRDIPGPVPKASVGGGPGQPLVRAGDSTDLTSSSTLSIFRMRTEWAMC